LDVLESAVELKGAKEDIGRCRPSERYWLVMLTVQEMVVGETRIVAEKQRHHKVSMRVRKCLGAENEVAWPVVVVENGVDAEKKVAHPRLNLE